MLMLMTLVYICISDVFSNDVFSTVEDDYSSTIEFCHRKYPSKQIKHTFDDIRDNDGKLEQIRCAGCDSTLGEVTV